MKDCKKRLYRKLQFKHSAQRLLIDHGLVFNDLIQMLDKTVSDIATRKVRT